VEQAAAHWYQNPEWWSAIGTIFAACVALTIASYTEVSGRIRAWLETRERRKCLAIALMMDLEQTSKTVNKVNEVVDRQSRGSQPAFQGQSKGVLRLPELTHLFGSVAQFYVLGKEASSDVLALAAEIRSWNHEIEQPTVLGCDDARQRVWKIESLIESSRKRLDGFVKVPPG
jgi:hypothetical protein